MPAAAHDVSHASLCIRMRYHMTRGGKSGGHLRALPAYQPSLRWSLFSSLNEQIRLGPQMLSRMAQEQMRSALRSWSGNDASSGEGGNTPAAFLALS